MNIGFQSFFNASNFSGYSLVLYKLAEDKDPNEDYGAHQAWGAITISLVFVPGIYRTLKLATTMKWRQMTWFLAAKNVLFLVVLAIVWPVFSILL